MPRRPLKLLAFLTVALLGGALGVYMAVNKLSLQLVSHRYDLPSPPLPPGWAPAALADAGARARGEHLVAGVLACAGCHGVDLAGRPLLTDPARALAHSGNLRHFAARARRQGGTDGDAAWVRALRFGLREDGRALWLMPQRALSHLTDEDLRAVVAYLRDLPDLDAAPPPPPPPHRLGAWGRVAVAARRLALFDLDKITDNVPSASPPSPSPPVEATVGYGAYLSAIGRCRRCHQPTTPWVGNLGASPLPVGPAWDPDALGRRGKSAFRRALAEGRRLDGAPLAGGPAWHDYSRLDGTEVEALWLALEGS